MHDYTLQPDKALESLYLILALALFWLCVLNVYSHQPGDRHVSQNLGKLNQSYLHT